MKTPERRRRDTAMTYAREYAKAGDVTQVQKWIERADAQHPITEFQLWRVKQLMGPYKFYTLDFSKIKNASTFPMFEMAH